MNTVVMQSTNLYYKDSTSDKVYNVTLEEADGGYIVNCSWGRRGSALQSATQTKSPVSIDKAISIYHKKITDKTSKGYVLTPDSFNSLSNPILIPDTTKPHESICNLLNPIEEDQAKALIADPNWIMQEKMDGVRMVVTRKEDNITAVSRTGREATIPKEVSDIILSTSVQNYIIDGELIGNVYHVFDLLRLQAMDFAAKNTFEERHEALTELLNGIDDTNIKVVKCYTGKEKAKAFEKLKSTEGVVFKHKNAFYRAGRPASGGQYLKHKFYKSCSAIVTRINDKRSVSLSLIEDKPEPLSEYKFGKNMITVGNCTIPVNHDFPQMGDIVEIKYLYARKPSNALYQPSYLGKRTDIPLRDCLLSQLIYKVGEEEE